MKNLYLATLLFFITFISFAQAPELMSYQALVRNANGDLIQDTSVGIRISILQDSETGTVVYTETHTVNTNENGLVTLSIGSGTTTDDFSTIDWGSGTYYIKSETDPTGGTNYTIAGTSQLLSVPYALYAKSTGNTNAITLTSPDGTEYELSVNDNGELSLPTSNNSSSSPSQLYLYGSFNNWDATSALAFGNNVAPYQDFIGVKYFTAGTEIKFLAAQNENLVYGGNSGLDGNLLENGNAIIIPNDGLYTIQVYDNGQYFIQSINVSFYGNQTMSYNSTLDTFFLQTTSWSNGINRFIIGFNDFGDNLADGSIEPNGAPITIPNTWNGALIQLQINFNSSGNYTLTQTN
ncbi:hypothetical protein [Winogradskyella sp.]|jgi:hypothetical protein|uniref:hypothetical protein n=1 Tax=Winogradskyella sp. TaxID=1883156 RepID=UPI0025E3BCDF|nr:hypothetical protein [Winogradskyella sp.]MCT4628504.1 hypothetical protein [Winogradskyella sp.]